MLASRGDSRNFIEWFPEQLGLKLFPLMYLFELHDILFAIKSIKTPTIQFNITNYINFSSTSIRLGANKKLILPHHLNNTSRHSYFHRLSPLWNTMPIFDLDMTFNKLKSKLKHAVFIGALLESF